MGKGRERIYLSILSKENGDNRWKRGRWNRMANINNPDGKKGRGKNVGGGVIGCSLTDNFVIVMNIMSRSCY